MGFFNRARVRLKRLKSTPSTSSSQSSPINEKHAPSPLRGDGPPRGFLAITSGDAFLNGRYIVRSELGDGRYSTVWLAEDTHNSSLVALKVLSSEFYNGGIQLFEVAVMRKLRNVSSQSLHPGRHHVAQLLNDFEHTAASGVHVCLVLAVQGETLQSQMTRAHRTRLPYEAAKNISRQLLQAFDFMHSECGVLHTDIQTSNILIKAVETNHDTAVVHHSDDKTGISSPSIFRDWDAQVCLIDFGLACWQDQHLTDRIQPPVLRAPEITLDAPWESSVDIYDLGCLIYYFVTGTLPFPGRPSSRGSYTAEDDRLATLMDIFGSVPEIVLANAGKANHFFDENRELRRTPRSSNRSPSGTHTPLEGLIDERTKRSSLGDEMPPSQVPAFCDFLRAMLATDPRQRKTAKELLGMKWLKTPGSGQTYLSPV